MRPPYQTNPAPPKLESYELTLMVSMSTSPAEPEVLSSETVVLVG